MFLSRGGRVNFRNGRQIGIIIAVWVVFFIVSQLCFAKDKDFVYDPHGKRDPMIPVVDRNGNVLFQEGIDSNGKKVLALMLQGIIYRKNGNSKIIIDKKLYKVGDNVAGFTIKRILPSRVILTDGEEDYELRLWKR